jgi:hypothetical protein
MVLGWRPRWSMEEAVWRTLTWYKAWYEEGDILTDTDIDDYEEEMR